MAAPKPAHAMDKPAGQDRKTFNAFKAAVKLLPELTPDQLASLHYETWHEAYTRSAGVKEGE